RQFDLVTALTEFGRRGGRITCCELSRKFEFTQRVTVHLGNLLRHFSVRSVLTSVDSVSNSGF
ncbi:MAG: hypothetical protein ABI273_20485, partial [Lacunisphaera sp.]